MRDKLARPPPEPELQVARDSSHRRSLDRRVGSGALQRLAPGLYVRTGTREEIAAIVRRGWQTLAAATVPGAVVSYLSALSGGITADNEITLAHPTRFNKVHTFPGLDIAVLKGAPPVAGDLQLGSQDLYWAGRSRVLLENLGRRASKRPRTAGRAGVEEYLVNILAASGEAGLNDARDRARSLAPELHRERELRALETIVSSLLGKHAKGVLRTRAGRLAARGTPADAERLARFETLAAHLRVIPLPAIPQTATSYEARANQAFFESYFSNYVEGTRFDVAEAQAIVFDNRVVASRPKDSHDVLGVFKMAVGPPYRDTVPPGGDDFAVELAARHAFMMQRRPEAMPGEFKLETNFAGTTRFVEPNLVRGTLAEGSKLAGSVPEGLARAICYGFLVSEIHPFNDGNGRLSRLLMNAELTRTGLARVIIPTLFHPQYLDCQRALTRGNDPAPLTSAIVRMSRWTSSFDFSDYDVVLAALRRSNAFEESPAQYRLLDAHGMRAA
jgi:hypothetical protein